MNDGVRIHITISTGTTVISDDVRFHPPQGAAPYRDDQISKVFHIGGAKVIERLAGMLEARYGKSSDA
jgi:hypothetical protein